MPVTEENKGRKCNVDGCFKFAVKDGKCTKCYNKAHGIQKRIGRKPKSKRGRPTNYEKQKEIAEAAPRNDKEKAAAKKMWGNNGSYEDIMLKLTTAKSEYQKKVLEIDNAIGVLKEYA